MFPFLLALGAVAALVLYGKRKNAPASSSAPAPSHEGSTLPELSKPPVSPPGV